MNLSSKSHACWMSKSYLRTSRCGIEKLLALLDGLAEVRIADGFGLNQIHGAPEELLQVLLQAEITFRVLGGAQLWKLDKKVEVARGGIEGAAGRRAEQQQSLHLPSTADFTKLQRLFFEDGVHRHSSPYKDRANWGLPASFVKRQSAGQ